MTTICVEISHKQAPIAVRERLAFPKEQLAGRLQSLRQLRGVREVLLISTCNRLDIFAAASSPESAEEILQALGPDASSVAARRFDESAIRHLFRVAASLESMVPGEAQILGQVKAAAVQAHQAGVLGCELRRAVDHALRAARRVRVETEIARGAISLSRVAVNLARKLLGDLTGRRVVLLGAGEMAHLAARELRAEGVREVLVANRSPAGAEELAREVGGVAVSLTALPGMLERADVIICSTGSPEYVITRELVAGAAKARRHRPLFLVDLSLPRNVDPGVDEAANVYLYDLDDLGRIAEQNRRRRDQEVSRAEELIEEELRAFHARGRERSAVPVLGRLRAHAQAVAGAEVERTLSSLSGLDERQQKSVRAMASAIVNKLLHGPTARLRAEAGDGPLADATAELFGLEEQQQREPALMTLVGNG
jgi:glutamyl-tRNA reductase